MIALLFAFLVKTHTVTLSWTPPPSLGTVNVYRASATCATQPYYTRIAIYVPPDGPYVDPVSPGTYSYYITAEVDGAESDPSNCVDVSLKGGK